VETHVQTGALGYLFEMARAIIVEEGEGGGFFALRNVSGPPGGIDEEQIGMAVVIEVQEGYATAHSFRQQLLAVRSVVVDESDPGRSRNVGEFSAGHFGQCPFGRLGDFDSSERCGRTGRRALEVPKQTANGKGQGNEAQQQTESGVTTARLVVGR